MRPSVTGGIAGTLTTVLADRRFSVLVSPAYKILNSEFAPASFSNSASKRLRPAVHTASLRNSSTWPVAGGAMQNLAQASIICRRF